MSGQREVDLCCKFGTDAPWPFAPGDTKQLSLFAATL